MLTGRSVGWSDGGEFNSYASSGVFMLYSRLWLWLPFGTVRFVQVGGNRSESDVCGPIEALTGLWKVA